MSNVRPRATDSARVIQVIETKALRGLGEDKIDPCRIVTQYWDFDGKMLASDDNTIIDNMSEDIEDKDNKIKELYKTIAELRKELSLLKIAMSQMNNGTQVVTPTVTAGDLRTPIPVPNV